VPSVYSVAILIRGDYNKGFASNRLCPRCGSVLKSWNELTQDDQTLAERLPAFADFPLETRKKHRFCRRCWYENAENLRDV